MALRADPLRSDRPFDFTPLVLPSFREDRQQHDSPTRSEPVADPHSVTAQMEPKFPGLAAKVARIRFPQLFRTLG